MKYLLIMVGMLLVLSLSVGAAEPKVLFKDSFAGKPGPGWSWLRENKKAWRIADKGLEIRVEPGVALTVQNALLREAPDRSKGTYAFEVKITFTTPPTNQYEQGGITWYHNEKPVFKLVHERIDGKTYIIPGKVPTSSKTVQLRLIVAGDKYTAQFRPEGQGEFKNVASGKLPPPGKDQVSIQCYNGPANAEHWVRFEDFRVLEMSK